MWPCTLQATLAEVSERLERRLRESASALESMSSEADSLRQQRLEAQLKV